VSNSCVSSVAERVKAPILQRPYDHYRVIEVQLPTSSNRRFTTIITAW